MQPFWKRIQDSVSFEADRLLSKLWDPLHIQTAALESQAGVERGAAFYLQRKAPPLMFDQRADILLVEDNPDDIELTLHAFKTANLANAVHVARDGVEVLDFVFCTGPHAGRSIQETGSSCAVRLDRNARPSRQAGPNSSGRDRMGRSSRKRVPFRSFASVRWPLSCLTMPVTTLNPRLARG
jgi:hypothetical protein